MQNAADAGSTVFPNGRKDNKKMEQQTIFQSVAAKAAKFGFPIRKPEDLPHPIITGQPDAAWDSRIQSNWWYDEQTISKELAERSFMSARLLELHKKLLSFGGYRTCLPVVEDDLDNILDRGQLWLGANPIMMLGQPSQCHRNSAACWEANRNKTILCTGYALSEDGMWRQHSWLVNYKAQRIVETTVERVAYFGFAMTRNEAQAFADDCY